MKRTFFGLLVSVAMTGTMVAAQSSQAPSPGQSQAGRDQGMTPSSASSATDTTVTGCLVQGTDSDSYLLQDVKMTTASASGYSSGAGASASSPSSSSGASASNPSSASGASGSASSASGSQASRSASASSATRGITYRLDEASGAKDLDFKTNLNHEVRLTGTLDRSSMSSSSSSSSASQSASAGQKVDEKSLPKFSAKTVTKIADTCSAIS
jgi:hypothetical protein